MLSRYSDIISKYIFTRRPVRATVITSANEVGRRLCIHPCLFVRLTVSKITLKEYRRIWTDFHGNIAHHSMTISLNFGCDLDIRSVFRIRNINFLKSDIAGELLVIRTCNQYKTNPKLF